MNPTANADLMRTLRALRWRMFAKVFLEKLVVSALLVAGALVVFGALHRWVFHDGPVPRNIVLGAAAATLLLALFGTVANRWSLGRVARIMDDFGETRDRFVTALALSGKATSTSPMHALAVAECQRFVRNADFRQLLRVGLPRTATWLVVPLVALLFMQWDFRLATALRCAQAVLAQKEVAGTVRQLQELALKAERATGQVNNAELRQLAEQLRASAERLQAETNADDARKSAMRELSALEETMKQLRSASSLTEEMTELAKALAPVAGMKDVLSALDEHNLAAAASALARAEKQANEEAAQPTEEQVKQSLERAMQRLGQQRQLSAALRKLSEQLRQGGSEGTKSAMEQLRKMIQQAQQAGSRSDGKGGQPMTIEQLIAALENMKLGEGQPGGSDALPSQRPTADARISMEAFAAAPPNGGPSDAIGAEPAGKPGTEKDFGTTADPFGGKSDPAERGTDVALKGLLTNGESLTTLLPSAGDNSRAMRRYKELYEVFAPAAEDALQQENIPVGSRFYIKRYFESIRPGE